jgi:hypothetical protein
LKKIFKVYGLIKKNNMVIAAKSISKEFDNYDDAYKELEVIKKDNDYIYDGFIIDEEKID